MPFRILPNGAQECDTIDEFRQLRSERGRPTSNQSKRRSTKSSLELTDSARLLLRALIKSPLNTDQAATELKVNAKQLPPILRFLAKWCNERKLNFGALMIRKPIFVNRRPQTEYRLTPEGVEIFTPLVDVASMNGKEATMNTG